MSNRNCNQYRPQVEALESWVPLSGAAGAIHAGAVAAAMAPIVGRQGPVLALSGTVQGGYAISGLIPDIGKTYKFGVAGRISPLGQTGDNGQIHTTGFIARGVATGTMTIGAPRGTVKLQLTGPTQPGFAPLPSTMSYTINGGTGAYKKATGSGTIAINLTSNLLSYGFGLVSLTFQPAPTQGT
jgi:hypothetical protein